MPDNLREPRYLIGAIICALLLENYLTALAPFLTLTGSVSVPALFFALTSVLLLFKAIDLISGETLAGDRRPAFETVFALILLVELALFIRIGNCFGEWAKNTMPAEEAVTLMYQLVVAVFVLDMIYQALAAWRHQGPATAAQRPVDIVIAAFKPMKPFKVTDLWARSIGYLIIETGIVALYLAFWAASGDVPVLLLAHMLAMIIYALGWLLHQRSKLGVA